MQKEYEVNVANLENNLERKLVDLRSKQKERIHEENKRLEEELVGLEARAPDNGVALHLGLRLLRLGLRLGQG